MKTVRPAREILSDQILTTLETYIATIPKGTHGKWASIHEMYINLNPIGKLSQNALRCRLKKSRHKTKQVLTTNNPITAEIAHEPTVEQREDNTHEQNRPACSSCRSRKRGCNPYSKNPDCERRKRSNSKPIASFFAAHQSG
ncbi:hypothetical protein PHMEG_00037390 [Phytophthora megakarya]|uniref:Uncharacterized protein n=1 Tax=Phytophthora megakarya TaxID=4795 RepID=A0A225UL48_9STRA|nr:hypothetical protein PHMEG_00037390 [Phytophthora megakarya]